MKRFPSKTIQVVLDTNVVVSAHLRNEGFERHALDLALAGKLQLAASEAILAEYAQVLARPKFAIARKNLARSMRLIRNSAQIVSPSCSLAIAHDPVDNRFLECAEAARADYLVTGNKRHFPVRWRQTSVVNARELIEWIAADLRR
ncbi:MAG: putative toxin-antitoxin system toxin component, PIN family [Candidatus Sulfotelmatobacter sp.]